jgi:hypothetical protein
MKAYEEISDRFNRNIDRVENLVHFCEFGRGQEESDITELEKNDDILRASLVFLHATLEDFLRSISAWKLPDSSPDEIDKIPLLGQTQKTPSKFNLGSLVAFRGLSVDELISQSIHTYLDKWASFNDISQINSALKDCGIELDRHDYGTLSSIVSRRHDIVHHADTVPFDATDSSLSPIHVDTLRESITATREFFNRISNEITKSYYLPQMGIPNLLEYAKVLAENGSVSLKNYQVNFDISYTKYYKLKADLINIGFGSIDPQKKHILSNQQKDKNAVAIAQRFCRNHAVFRAIINDPRLKLSFSQEEFVEIVGEVCGENFKSSRSLELRSKKLLRLFWTTGFISQKGNELTLLRTPSSAAAQNTIPENITRTRLTGLFFGDSPPLSLVNGLVQLVKKNVDRAEANKLVGRNAVRSLLKLGLITSDLRPNTKTTINSSTARAFVRDAALQDAVIKFCVRLVSQQPELGGKKIGQLVSENFECSWVERSQMRNGNALAGWAHWVLGDGSSSTPNQNLQTPKQIANALRTLTPKNFGTLPLIEKYKGTKNDLSVGRPTKISKNLYAAISILRLNYGLSTDEIAKRIGVSVSTLHRTDKRYRS